MRTDLSDEEIVNLIQSGESDPFGVLIKRYEDKMRRYAKKFLADKEDVEDIIQEVFIKTYRNIQGFDVKRKFSPWLYRIAHNELVNTLKNKKRILPLFDLDVFLPHSLKDNSLEKEIEKNDIKEVIDECLNLLELKYREPVILYYLEGLNYKEIADIMQIPVSTVGVRIKRAKEMLKIIYNKKYE